jgi:hypothetical protein
MAAGSDCCSAAGHSLGLCLASADFSCYIGGSSFVMLSVFHFTSGTYGLFFAVNAVGMVASSGFSRMVVSWVGPTLLLRSSFALTTGVTLPPFPGHLT